MDQFSYIKKPTRREFCSGLKWRKPTPWPFLRIHIKNYARASRRWKWCHDSTLSWGSRKPYVFVGGDETRYHICRSSGQPTLGKTPNNPLESCKTNKISKRNNQPRTQVQVAAKRESYLHAATQTTLETWKHEDRRQGLKIGFGNNFMEFAEATHRHIINYRRGVHGRMLDG